MIVGPRPAATSVWTHLRQHYPPHVIDWVRGMSWQRRQVPLSQIHMQPRPGEPRDPVKVAGIRKARAAGRDLGPVTLVQTPHGRAKIADGYHRLEAARMDGAATHDALVGRTAARRGPWSRQMHDAKLNT